MNTVKQVMTALEKAGGEQTRKTYARHGVNTPMFGVKIADLKVIARKIKGNQQLALGLYDTGNHDAMYLAGLVADGAQMTKKQLEAWAKGAGSNMIAEYTVPPVVCESEHARGLAMKWIDAKSEMIACCGWCTYSGVVATREDEALDMAEIRKLLARVVKTIRNAPGYVPYVMNGFVISVGGYVKPLLKEAKAAAKEIGTVEVDMGDTACKVPLAAAYIAKIEKMGRVGKKRKTMKC